MNHQLLGHFWYRSSTLEWVFEVEFKTEGYITSISRYTGKTKTDALKSFVELFKCPFEQDLELLKKSGFVDG